jgi:hypothetical protein
MQQKVGIQWNVTITTVSLGKSFADDAHHN